MRGSANLPRVLPADKLPFIHRLNKAYTGFYEEPKIIQKQKAITDDFYVIRYSLFVAVALCVSLNLSLHYRDQVSKPIKYSLLFDYVALCVSLNLGLRYL